MHACVSLGLPTIGVTVFFSYLYLSCPPVTMNGAGDDGAPPYSNADGAVNAGANHGHYGTSDSLFLLSELSALRATWNAQNIQ